MNTFLIVREQSAPDKTGAVSVTTEPVASFSCCDDVHAERLAKAIAWAGDYHVERREPPTWPRWSPPITQQEVGL